MAMRSTLGLASKPDGTAPTAEQAPEAQQPSAAEQAPAADQPIEAERVAHPAPAPAAVPASDAEPPSEGEPAPVADAMDDGALIARSAQRDAAALVALYDRHIAPTYSLAIRIVGEPDGAEAVVQEVFAQVWSGAVRPTDTGGSAARWLLALTRAHAIERARSRGARDAESAGSEATVELPRPAMGFDDDTGDGPRLRAALDRLSTLQRLCVELAFFDGLTLAQIAARLEQPEATVHKRIRSGLAHLRDAIGDES